MEWKNVFIIGLNDESIINFFCKKARECMKIESPDSDSEDIAHAILKCYKTFINFRFDDVCLLGVQSILKEYTPLLMLYKMENVVLMGVIFIKKNGTSIEYICV